MNNTYSLIIDNFLKYKELGFIKYEDKQRLLLLADGYDINVALGTIKLYKSTQRRIKFLLFFSNDLISIQI